jgi:hypothetical protein
MTTLKTVQQVLCPLTANMSPTISDREAIVSYLVPQGAIEFIRS